MNKSILIVDDEKNVLEALRRQLTKQFSVTTALGAPEGLSAIQDKKPFAVIMSDLRMPKIDGIKFLAKAKELAPDSVRIILTGNADLNNAIQAVNEGNIYRFLTKPCDTDLLLSVLGQAVEQYRLITAEKVLLEKTLKGSIKLLTELLSTVNPEAFGRSSRIKRYAREIAITLGIKNIWQIETTAMLSQIGCVTLPENVLDKINQGEELNQEETRLFHSHPQIAYNLLSNIPRLENVAAAILHQGQNYSGPDFSSDIKKRDDIPMGARILKVVSEFDLFETKGFTKEKALNVMKQLADRYDPDVLKALEHVIDIEAKYIIKTLVLKELRPHMILYEDVKTVDGKLIISRGQNLTPILVERLATFSNNYSIKEPIRVVVPLKKAAQQNSVN